MPTVTGFIYRDCCDDYMGWCTECAEFTRHETEPDAEHYECPVCANKSVFGAEQALLLGYFDVVEEED